MVVATEAAVAVPADQPGLIGSYNELVGAFNIVSNSRYGPPTRTEYRVIVENLSSRVSWQVSYDSTFLSQ